MITLEEYLNNKKYEEYLLDIIDKDFINYFITTWRLNHKLINMDESYLYEENIDAYDGQFEQAKVIDDNFKNNKLKLSKDDFKGINNIYFKCLYIHIKYTDKKEFGRYHQADSKYSDYNEVRWNKEDNEFNFIEFTFYIHKDTKSIYELVIHELRHYFDDYQGFYNNKITLDTAVKKSKYSRFIYNDNDDSFRYNVKQLNNICSSIEKHAYISQLIGQITDILKDKKYSTIHSAINDLIKSKEYKTYKDLKEFVHDILKDNELQKEYIKIYREITNTTLLNNKIIENLDKNFNEFWSLLQKNIYVYIEKNHLIKESINPGSIKIFIESL